MGGGKTVKEGRTAMSQGRCVSWEEFLSVKADGTENCDDVMDPMNPVTSLLYSNGDSEYETSSHYC